MTNFDPKNKKLILVLGPTASGKTGLAIQLAQHYKTEIISCDARQFYREMSIGTAKPDAEELAAAPHHFINNLSIYDEYSVGDYEREALALLEQLYEQHDIVVMVGGSGLFARAVCEGLDKYPEVPATIRQALVELFEQEGIEALQAELKESDPDYYERVDLSNHQRLIRALEVCRVSGKPFSSFQGQPKPPRFFQPIKLAIEWPRDALYERINRRVDLMVEQGLEKEARKLFHLKQLNALQTVGYKEFFEYFEGSISKEEAIELIKRNTRRYAKRQMTWLRKEKEVKFCSPEQDLQEMLTFIKH